tara:strand:- start:9959 stop:10123 length:165 start_codon:yes stop_codon:yes gene_type:complete
MKIGDLVRVVESHISAGDSGVVVECTNKAVNVYWAAADATYWIEKIYLEVIHEN